MDYSKHKLLFLCCSVIGLSFITTGCQKKEPSTSEKPAVSEVKHEAPTFKFTGNVVTTPVHLNECSGRNCPEFSVKHIQSNAPFIDQTIQQASLDQLKEILESSDTTAVSASNSASIPETTENDYRIQVQKYADSFMALDEALKKLSANGNISLHVEPKIIKQTPQMVVVQLSTDSFLGGAHGSASQQYFNFDLATKQQLHLEDILQPEQEKALEKLAHDQFEKWIKRENLAESTSDYEEAWTFKLSHNFYFNDKGLVLQYGEYEIGPYVVGMPSFTIGYEQLVGIVKPNYLPKNM